MAGNTLPADVVWTFTTMLDTTPPTVTAVTPANGAKKVNPGNPLITARFSEAMNSATISSATVFLVVQGQTNPVAASVAYNGATSVATLTPSSRLAGTTTYRVTIKGATGGVQDASGNALAVDYVWTFTTK